LNYLYQKKYSFYHSLPLSPNDTKITSIMSGLDPEKVVTLEVRGRVAIITLCNEKKLNAMTQDTYFRLSQLLRQVAKMDEVFITVLTGKGRFFSA
jgi:peroxisomal 3,2-trans-enoyl-CoA isomerase